METKFEENKLNFYKKIDTILWQKWDPIGVNEIESARDEYYGYIPEIYNLKITNASKNEIAEHLNKIATINLGLFENLKHCEEIAELILQIK